MVQIYRVHNNAMKSNKRDKKSTEIIFVRDRGLKKKNSRFRNRREKKDQYKRRHVNLDQYKIYQKSTYNKQQPSCRSNVRKRASSEQPYKFNSTEIKQDQ